MKTTTELVKGYHKQLGDPHDNLSNPFSLNSIDFRIRTLMGKTKETSSKDGFASHMRILKRQRRINEDSLVCRRCLKDLDVVGIGRWNDFLVIRAKDCTQPICHTCAKNNPDVYHIKFREALRLRKIGMDLQRETAQ
jgi:hypothetical protein